MAMISKDSVSKVLLAEIKNMIDQAKVRAFSVINRELVLLNWNIGKRIKIEIVQNARASYGDQIVATLSQQLKCDFGSGFTQSALSRMIKFYEEFPDFEIVATLSQQLGWSHFVELIPIEDPVKREFYAEICRVERWSVRVLRDRIKGMLFERTVISRKPESTILHDLDQLRKSGNLSKDLTLKDPYVLEFLNLEDTYSERDLESAILHKMEKFLLELGGEFSFIARQKRLTISGEDYYLDLLFFHRTMKRLIVVELKLGKFNAAYKGQMELYLRWLDKYERKEGEASPLGIILCAEKDCEQIELLQLNEGDIHVAQYITKPLENRLRQELHLAIESSRLKNISAQSKQNLL
ncbi:MAG: DUF1016 family protein [Alphaproteobacteria bacterium]|jgi:predicted nuclease of restriction endonuclease-like (RecB) superfamily|nr:DUF1016 family protein [Alphaproteobacteria bacterium]MBP9876962.1 DUF1016 family protein [Alphaproteobacteria bacterium]